MFLLNYYSFCRTNIWINCDNIAVFICRTIITLFEFLTSKDKIFFSQYKIKWWYFSVIPSKQLPFGTHTTTLWHHTELRRAPWWPSSASGSNTARAASRSAKHQVVCVLRKFQLLLNCFYLHRHSLNLLLNRKLIMG